MNTERDKKALKAFWCVLNNADKDERRVSYLYNELSIYGSVKESEYVVGKIRVNEEKMECCKKILGITISKTYHVQTCVWGYVVNTKDSNIFYFSFDEDEAVKIKQKVRAYAKKNRQEKIAKEEKSLNNLIC